MNDIAANPMNKSNTSLENLKAPSLWRAPSITWRWWPVFLRNLLVWKKLFWPSLIGNTADPLIGLVAFGYGLGALVGSVSYGGQTVPYIVFIASGYSCMSAMNAASFEALYSAFSRMQMQKTWDGIMNAPVGLDDVVFAETLWAAYKSLFTVTVMMAVLLLLGISREWTLLLALPVLLLVGVTFACLAMIFTSMAKGYDFFTYYFTLFLTPMVYLSGVFFPREQLPAWLQAIAQWLPLGAAIDIVRPLFLGQLPVAPWRNLAILVAFAVLSFWLAIGMMRKRFRA
jgi:lipooligosaccharide transport system permease protein